MNEKYFDFDSFIKEKEETPITIKIFGKKEHLQGSLPASVVLKIVRLQRKGVKEVEENAIFEMAELLFGKDRFKKWLDKGLTVSQLEVLIKNVVELYQKPQKDSEEVGNSTKTP